MKNLLLLDADVAIDFHKLGYWSAILKQYNVYLTGIVIDEIKYYETQSGVRVMIDLQPHLTSGKIIQLDVQTQTHDALLKSLRIADLHEVIGDGELDCICALHEDKVPDLTLGLKDGIAIQSVAYLDMDDRTMCIEDLLKQVGILRQTSSVPYQYSSKRYRDLICKGKFLQTEKPAKTVGC